MKERIFHVGKGDTVTEVGEDSLRHVIAVITDHEAHSKSLDKLLELIVRSPNQLREVGTLRVEYRPDEQPSDELPFAGAMSDSEYVARGGLRCPSCRSNEITASDFDSAGSQFWQKCSCSSCGATWSDRMKLTGYSELEVPQAPAEEE